MFLDETSPEVHFLQSGRSQVAEAVPLGRGEVLNTNERERAGSKPEQVLLGLGACFYHFR